MAVNFSYDIFLSHSSKDKAIVRTIAERLHADGLRVWFDDWTIRAGDNIPAKIEEGLEQSRVLVLCISANAFGSDWPQLEANTYRFRDPLNKDRRFIPLRLGDAPIKASLAQFVCINWAAKDYEPAYAKLLEACRPPFKPDATGVDSSQAQSEEQPDTKGRVVFAHKDGVYAVAISPDGEWAIADTVRSRLKKISLTETYSGLQKTTAIRSEREAESAMLIRSVAISPDGKMAVTCSSSPTVQLWNLETMTCVRKFVGNHRPACCVAIFPKGNKVVSGSYDGQIRIWKIKGRKGAEYIHRHGRAVKAVVVSPEGETVISGSEDSDIHLWNASTGQLTGKLEGHTEGVTSLAISSDGRTLCSGSHDKTIRVWDIEQRKCTRVLEAHTARVFSVAITPNTRTVVSASFDKTIRVWDLDTGECLSVLRGHTNSVRSVAITPDGRHLVSGSIDGTVRLWELPTARLVPFRQETVQYTNAKVLIVGESGSGKTGLSKRLASNSWQPSDSTVGAWATQWKLPVSSHGAVEREIWLWDFGGQADQRLIHQLYMDDTALAVLVFDGQKEDIFETLGQWDRDLSRASRKEFAKLLVAGRVDAGGLRVSRDEIEKFASERDFQSFLETSAKTNLGCEQLREAVLGGINWDGIPCRTTQVLFKRLKDEIIRLKDEGRVLMRFNELRETLQLELSGEFNRFTDEELSAVLSLLAVPGVVWELKFGSWVLLQPELINAYAQAVIQTMRDDPQDRGCIAEEKVLSGTLNYQSAAMRLPEEQERILLLAVHQTLVERALCLRELTDTGMLLVFPGYYRRERPELVGHPAVQVSYQFNGFLDDIYATLVVRLHHTKTIDKDQLWRYAADFKTLTGKKLGVKLRRLGEGRGELEVYFDPTIPVEEKIIFSKFIHEHVTQKGQDVVRLRHYVCPHCGTPAGNREVAMKRLADWQERQAKNANIDSWSSTDSLPSMICAACEERFPLWDEMEKYFASPSVHQRVLELQDESTKWLDNESTERALIGELISTVALAGQISRELPVSDQGIDMEIEFKDDAGVATGRKLYINLKAGNSYLTKRTKDGLEILTIKDDDHIRYWMAQESPVLVVIQNGKDQIRWMDVRDWLKRASDNGTKRVEEIVFEGERLDVMSVRRWRDRELGDPLLHYNRDSLLDVLNTSSDERMRCKAARRLAGWPEDDIRDRLLALAKTDPSIEIQVVCCEALCDGWWKERKIRHWIRTRIAAEPVARIRKRLIRAAQGARSQLAGLWESRLSNQKRAEPEPEAIPGYPAFQVLKFRLRDIGPFKDTGDVELQADINVFLGDNAAGKTTLMRCLALASVGLAAANEVVDNAGAYLRKGAQRGSIEVLFQLVPDPDALPGESGLFAVGLEITAESSRFAPIRELTIHSIHSPKSRLANSAEPLSTLRSKGNSLFGFVSGYGAVRTFGESRFSIQTELKKPENEWVLSLFKSEAWLVNPEVFSKLIRGDTSNIEGGPPSGLSPELIAALRNSLKHLFPEVSTFFPEGDDDLQLKGTPLRFGELSDGYRSLFALIGHLLRCSLKVRNWTDNPMQIHGIALIDEMDLHLHPAWQIHAVRDFRKAFPNLQLIASTHSPLVVAALKRKNVMIMRSDDDGSIVVARPEFDPQGLGVAGILTGIFDLSSTIDQPTLDKITHRLLLHSRREQWTKEEETEYAKLTEYLASLGFNREFTDPYYERFATAMAKRHRATLGKLTRSEKRELDEYADRLLTNLKEGDGG